MSPDSDRNGDSERDASAHGDDISTDETLAAPRGDEPYGATMPASSAKGAPADVMPKVKRSRYEIGAELARGGMGRILRARDQRLGRPVAVKELIAKGPNAAARFVREAALTARLQHPSIVPIYEAGTWEDGAPFYAMKMVEGRSLDEAFADAKTLRERLALLPHIIATADAVAYAHSRRVIHRDLKPANVIVGAYGETVIIDWGLGKDLTDGADADPRLATGAEGDSSLTIVGSAMGTPAYMPPEQARGRDVDESADVYAIGAMLYRLLAGKPPYSGGRARSADEALGEVVAHAPTPLSQLAPDAPEDLLAIAEKAMARKASERYPTAKELADDLKRYATGQLVGAHQYTAWDLVRRWLGRRRASVAVAVAAAVALLAGGLVSVQRIREERTAAEEQRRLAEQNRGEVEGLLDFMLSDLRRKLRPIGKLELLDMVAQKAVDYYARRPTADEGLDETHKRAAALTTYADVLWRQGEREAALKHTRTALALRRRLVEQAPENRDWQYGLSVVLFRLGDMLHSAGDLEACLERYRESLRIRERLAAQPSAHPELAIQVAASMERIGYVYQARGDLAGALQQYQAATDALEAFLDHHPDHYEGRRDLAAVTSELAYVLQIRGDMAGALSRYHRSLELFEEVVKSDPSRPDWQNDLAVLRTNVADIELAQGSLTPALEQYRAAQALLTRLTELDPRNTSWARGLAAAHSKVGFALQLRGDLDAALVSQRAAAAIRARLNARDPDDVRWQRELANSYVLLASLLAARGEHSESRALATKCGALYSTTAVEAEHFYNAACCFSLAGDRDRAFDMLGKCLDRGYADADALVKDADLAPLRSDPRWRALIDGLRTGAGPN